MNDAAPTLALEPDADLLQILDAEIGTAVRAEHHGQGVYRSLKKLSELIGGEYGDRVIYELLQNAHDAQPRGEAQGAGAEVAIRLVVDAPDRGELYVANGGAGFTRANVQAVRNIANSTKEVGEGIGNKGVGFRSVEALTDDAHIYSCRGVGAVRDRFDGYCFRFARPEEVRDRLVFLGTEALAESVAAALPRYLAALPVADQPDAVRAFAQRGFATVVRLPLRSAESISLAERQVRELIESDAPVLLFLERISTLEVSIEGVVSKPRRAKLTRHAEAFPAGATRPDGQSASVVTLSPDRQRWLLVRRALPKERVLEAVEKSIPLEAGLKAWRDWRGEASVGVATPLEGPGLAAARLYTFLPMAAEARSPCFAHVDAPFFTNISRRQARLDLPLNAYLLDAAAEACASEALALVQARADVLPRCIVDLVAWRPEQRARLANAFVASSASLRDAAVWPTTAKGWCGLAQLKAWPEGEFKVFTAARATKAGARNILARLPQTRATAIGALAAAASLSVHPAPEEIADWAEAVAADLPPPKPDETRWSAFFADLALALDDGADLDALHGRRILPDRSGQLQSAGEGVYVRQDARRKHDGVRLPPRSVARKLLVLSEDIRPRQETVAQFERAELWRRYDATEILERLPELFGDKPALARRRDALVWAFEVWCSDRQGARRALAGADLHVETRGGWRLASLAAFSEKWTDTGRELDAFLAEAAAVADDCAEAADGLLLAPEELVPQSEPLPLRDWVAFLSDAGVVDGLVAAAVPTPQGPMQGASWKWKLQGALEGYWPGDRYDEPYHPYTEYFRDGEAWKLPGQQVVAQLSPEARRRFAALVVRHLEAFGEGCLGFTLLRSDRTKNAQDPRRQMTPLSLFLADADWFPMETAQGLEFVTLDQAWLVPERRSELRFAPRPADEIGPLLAKANRAVRLLCDEFELNRWRDPGTAAARMRLMADLCEDVSQHERPQLQAEYVRAWQDLLAQGAALEAGTPLIVRRPEGFAPLTPEDEVDAVYVADGASLDLGKLLIESGRPVLAVTDQVDAAAVIAVINAAGDFVATSAAAAEIRLLVDGEPFSATPSDPLLVDVLPWIADALVIGHELGARSLERRAQVSAVLEKLQRLRLRRATDIGLGSGDGGSRRLTRHLHRDEDVPTLIVAEPFDSRRLESCATILTDYLNQNLRTFELLLVKLAHRMPADADLGEVHPSDDDYADALDFDVGLVREYLSAHRRNDRTKVDLAVVVVAYFSDPETARALEPRLGEQDPGRWTVELAQVMPGDMAQALLEALEATDDLAALRRELGLDYARLNRAAIALGRGPMTSQAELERAFVVRTNELRPQLRDRLRRHFAASWREPAPLATYTEAKTLDFVSFDPGWIETEEMLSLDTVARRAAAVFEERFGADPGGKLPAYDALRTANRKAVTQLAEPARQLLRAGSKDGMAEAWGQGAKAVADALENGGYLDFEPLDNQDKVFDVLARAGLWPDGVPQSLDLAAHGLTPDDLDRQKRDEAERKAAQERARNRVEFAGLELDAAAPDFAARFAEAAHEAFGAGDWRTRTKLQPVKLAIQPEVTPSGPGGRGSRKTDKPPTKPPEPLRAAIGLAGELLAFQYLKAKHPKHFNETCWVSENRSSLFPEPGSISEGCDFRVQTTEREWLYEVKATPYDGTEFELTDGEYRAAVAAAERSNREYRILFVQHAFDPSRCRVLELLNPAGRDTRLNFRTVGRSSVRMRFDLS